MVLTSHDELGDTGNKTGFWLEGVCRPPIMSQDCGAQIVLASPKGAVGPKPPWTRKIARSPDGQAREATKNASERLILGAEGSWRPLCRLADVVGKTFFSAIFYPGRHGPLWGLDPRKPFPSR